MASLTFLGTGGGRFVILNQRRYSGGLWLDLEATISLDPGPGALIRALQYGKNPQKLDAVFVSHNHLDHYNDAELMIEAMTRGMRQKRGTLVINKAGLDYISEYHRGFTEVLTPEPGDLFEINGMQVQALPTKDHADGVGYKFFSSEGVVAYSADTGYSENLVPYYKGAKILILNTIFPASKEIDVHLNTRTAGLLVKAAGPDLALINHFGMTILNAGPEKEAKNIEDATGVRTLAAIDGMSIDLKDLKASKEKAGQSSLSGF